MSNEVYQQRQKEWYTPYLERFKPLSSPFLELGAGYGLLLELARTRGLEVSGVEYDPSRVELCQAKGLNVVQHDLANPLPYADESFANIYCGQVIEHVPPATQRMLVKEARRVLQAGGQFQICSPCRHVDEARKQPGHDYLLTPNELRQLLEEAGFREIRSLDHPQKVPELPPEVLMDLWRRYRPELLSESASAMCIK